MKVPLEQLKKRWNVRHNWEIAIILIVFTLTGSSTVYLYGFIKTWIGLTPETFWGIKIIAFIFIALPIYNTLLILWGSLLGQGQFFIKFVRHFKERLFAFLRR